jgi:hypothetical protein
MSISIIDYKDIDINQIELSHPEKIKGSYYSFATYKGEDIYIKTPMLTNLSNIVKLDTRCYIELDIDTTDKETNEFYEFLSNFDDNNILKIHKESETWFNKPFPLDVVEDFYTTPLKHKNSPKLKIKIPLIKNKIDCLIYDKNNTIINNFNEKNKVICLLKFCGLKFLSQQVISEWIPIQIKTNQLVGNHNIEYLINDNFKTGHESAQPETMEPESAQPETMEPESAQPETMESESAQSETMEPESAQPETMEPESAQPETMENNQPKSTESQLLDIDKLKKELEKYKQLFFNTQEQLTNIKNLII